MDNGGPVIRYRTATELMVPDENADIKRLTDDLLEYRQVRTWLENLLPPVLLLKEPLTRTSTVLQSGMMEIHGSKPTNVENVLGKLTDFGLKKGMPELDRRTLLYTKWVEENAEHPIANVFAVGSMGMLAAFLARAGYAHASGVRHTLRKRLDIVYDFTRKGHYDIYIPDKYLRKLPCIKLELTKGGICSLPLIHDIVGWAAYLPKYGTEEDRAKADTIIKYIFNEEYQKFPWGYGIMGDGTGRTWSLGWSVHLPGFFNAPDKKLVNPSVVQMIGLLINFKAARQQPWFREKMEHLEGFRTAHGTYLFPAEYLQEKKMGYWVNGVHMALEDSPRTPHALEVESTFWMAKFHRMLTT